MTAFDAAAAPCGLLRDGSDALTFHPASIEAMRMVASEAST